MAGGGPGVVIATTACWSTWDADADGEVDMGAPCCSSYTRRADTKPGTPTVDRRAVSVDTGFRHGEGDETGEGEES